jgi:hypothetical protein
MHVRESCDKEAFLLLRIDIGPPGRDKTLSPVTSLQSLTLIFKASGENKSQWTLVLLIWFKIILFCEDQRPT